MAQQEKTLSGGCMDSDTDSSQYAAQPNHTETAEERKISSPLDATMLQLRVLQAVSDIALEHLELEDLLRESVRQMRALLGVDNVAILLLSEDGKELTLHTVEGPEETVASQVHVPFGRGIAGRIAATKAPMIVDDLSLVEVSNLFLKEHFRSLVGVPLLVQDRVVGVIHMDTVRPHHFSEDDAHLLEMIAQRLALAIDHARLYKAEQEARAEAIFQAGQLRATFDAIKDGLMVMDQQGRIVHANEPLRAIMRQFVSLEYLALPLAERAQRAQFFNEQGEVIPAAAWPQTRVLAGEVLTDAGATDVVARTFDGRDVYLNASGAPIRNAEGHITGAVLLFRDVTERRLLERRTNRALEALLTMAELLVRVPSEADLLNEPFPNSAGDLARQMAELTCTVLGCSRIGIILIDPETELMRPLAVVGLPPEQEREWWASQPTDARLSDSPMPEMVAQLRRGESLLIDMRKPPFNEAPNPYHVSIFLTVPLRSGERLTGLMTLDHSGVEHHYTEQELGLASAVGTLTAVVLEHERLLRQREEARANELALRAANRQMSEFLSIVSHELRTPLTSVSAYIQRSQHQLRRMLAPSAGQEVQPTNWTSKLTSFQETLDRAHTQVKRLNRLIGDLLDVARIEADKLELMPLPCDLAVIVRDAVQAQQIAWPNRIIALDLASEHVPLVADAERISQVVSNFLTNALKYSPQDQRVQVNLLVYGEQARVLVRDRGPGLSPEQQEMVWERFQRVPGIVVQSGSGVGLGLGLYICKSLIERHHGQVGVESTPGQGSTFWFTLPLARNEAASTLE
jgi:signal transduction histidine kinase/putative methionine-R-sulfoxide reductase with GAF domain